MISLTVKSNIFGLEDLPRVEVCRMGVEEVDQVMRHGRGEGRPPPDPDQLG